MAWSAPLTAVTGATLSAAEFNSSVRDNLLETEPARATALGVGSLLVGDGPNRITQRRADTAVVLTSSTTSSTVYTNLGIGFGPTVSMETGERALVFVQAELTNNSASWSAYISHEVTGASTVAASDQWAARRQGTDLFQGAGSHLHLALTPGSNTFTMKYRVAGGQGTFLNRRIIVIPF